MDAGRSKAIRLLSLVLQRGSGKPIQHPTGQTPPIHWCSMEKAKVTDEYCLYCDRRSDLEEGTHEFCDFKSCYIHPLKKVWFECRWWVGTFFKDRCYILGILAVRVAKLFGVKKTLMFHNGKRYFI